MRVALVAPYPRTTDAHGEEGLGGVASYTKSLAGPLRDEAELIVLSPHDGPAGHRDDGAVTILDVPRRGRALERALRELGRTGVQAVHVQFEQHLYGGPLQNLRLARALRQLRRKTRVVLTIHQVPDLASVDRAFLRQNGFPPIPALARAWMRFQYSALIEGADVVVVHEKRLADRLESQYGVARGRARVVPHGVDPAHEGLPQAEAKTRLGMRANDTLLLYFGFITGYKGVDLLVEALERIPPEARAGVRVIIAGKAPDRKMERPAFRAEIDALEARARALGAWVERKGFLTGAEVRLHLDAADVVLFPYRQVFSASGPLALALGHARPFLVSDAFAGMGLPERAMFPRSPEGLALKIRDFLEDPVFRRTLAEQAASIRDDRSWPRVARLTARCYHHGEVTA